MKIVKSLFIIIFVTVVFGYNAHAQIAFGQMDDFEDGTVQGWGEGASSPNPPQNITDGGPGGTGDNYLQNVSAGGGGAGSKMVMENEIQWAGNYISAGITYINMEMINLGSTDLNMRISIDGSGGRFSTANSVLLTVGSGWQQVNISISPSDFTAIGGSDINATLGNVSKVRILSNTSPNWHGQSIAATLGVDNITASDGTVSIENGEEIFAIEKHTLMQNYPNPFNPTTTINYSITQPGFVEMSLFDITGKHVNTLVKGFQQPNAYSIDFTPINLASGMYFYNLRVDNQLISTRKMILLK